MMHACMLECRQHRGGRAQGWPGTGGSIQGYKYIFVLQIKHESVCMYVTQTQSPCYAQVRRRIRDTFGSVCPESVPPSMTQRLIMVGPEYGTRQGRLVICKDQQHKQHKDNNNKNT